MKFLKSTFLTALLALIGGAVYAGCTARATYTQNGSTVTFYNDSSTSITGNHTLTWNFGDGTTGSGDQVVHRYSPGTYTACLIIADSTLCSDSTCMIITVTNTGGGCQASSFVFVDSSNSLKYYFNGSAPPAGGSASWQLNDNGVINYSGQNASHVFSKIGTYEIVYTLNDSNGNVCSSSKNTIKVANNSGGGCQASSFVFVDSANSLKYYFNGSAPPAGGSASWQLNDNGVINYSGQNASHVFSKIGTYEIVYTLNDSNGNVCSSSKNTIKVANNSGGGNNCNASFTSNVDSANSLKYYFDGSAPLTSGSASWQLYDNGVINYSGQNASHTFTSSGTYNVAYILKDSNGYVCDTTSQRITVTNNNTPSCKASYYVALDSNNKFSLYLVNNSTGTNSNTQYFWDFGDGTTSNAQYPTHQYANFGLYTVCLTIMDSNSNCYSTYCDSVGLDSSGNILKTSGFGIAVIDEAMLGVEEQTTAFTGVNVYPNPSSGKFTFTIDSKKGAKMTMRVMNSMGQQVAQNETYLTTGSNKTQLDLSSLSDGLYFVNLRAGDEVKSVRLYLAR